MLWNVADVGLDVAEKGDVIISCDGRVTLVSIGVDIHLDLADSPLADRPSPDKGGVEWFVLGYGIPLWQPC